MRWLLVAALLGLSACTARFVYNRLDFIIPFYFGQRVSLEEPQELQLRSVVRGLTAWHRDSQLERYSGFLRELARNTARPASREEIEQASRALERFWYDMVQEAIPEGSRWLRSLSRAQVDELLRSFAEDDAEDREEYCEQSADKLIARREKTLMKSVKKWSGTLDDAQEGIVQRTARQMRVTGCEWLDSRARWRAELKAALFESRDAAQTEERLRALMVEPQRTWTPEYKRDFEANRALFIDMLTELDGTWSGRQRKHIATRLTDIADELDALANGAPKKNGADLRSPRREAQVAVLPPNPGRCQNSPPAPSLTVTSLVQLPAASSQLTVTSRLPVLPFGPVTVVLRV